jgi:hypothetical protein
VIRKLPPDAFEYYFSLGPSRSHEAVSEHYGVAKRTVTALAVKDRWKERLAALEQKAREKSDERMVESLEQMNERHLKTLKLIQRKSLEALLEMPVASADEAIRSLLSSIKHERLIRGEPTDRTVLDTETLIRREAASWMTFAEEDDWSDAVDPVNEAAGPKVSTDAGQAPADL